MTANEIREAIVQLTPVLTTFVLPSIGQLVKQPRFKGVVVPYLNVELNTVLAYAACITVSSLTLWATGREVNPAFVTAMVGGANAFYALYFKNTKLSQKIEEIGAQPEFVDAGTPEQTYNGPQEADPDQSEVDQTTEPDLSGLEDEEVEG